MDNISFRRLKITVKSKGLSFRELSKMTGISEQRFSAIATGWNTPKTDMLAKICSALKVYPSEIVTFEGIEINEKYFTNDKREPLPDLYIGEVTYKPLWLFLSDYLTEVNAGLPLDKQKKENDLFDQIEPPRRVNGAGYNSISQEKAKEMWKKSIETRYGKDYESKSEKREYIKKQGLPNATRTKLRNDRPLNLSVIYEICKKLGCTIDFVLSYK